MPFGKIKLQSLLVIIYYLKAYYYLLIIMILICLKIISVAVREMSEGELLQIEKARQLDITEDVYYDIIRQKTATLIAACCSLGAASVKPNSQDVEIMRKFGELIGMAFQIKDDLFDYGDEANRKAYRN